MKKFFSLFMIITLSLSLSACSSEPKIEEVEEVEEEQIYVRGEWVDQVYTNDYLGFSFTLPEGWVSASDEELYSMLDTATEEAMSEDMKEQYDKAVENATSFYDFAIFSPTTGESIILTIEDLSKTVGAILLTEDLYLDALETNLSNVEGIDYEIMGREDSRLKFGQFRVLNMNIQDVMTQKYYLIKDGKYMISFVFAYLNDKTEGIDFILSQLQ